MTKPLSPTELKRLHRQWRRRTDVETALILDGVQNPYNLGAILRSAAAYRVDPLWVAPPTVDPRHPKVAKTALGSDRLVQIDIAESGSEAVARARSAGFTTVALELTVDAVPIFELKLPAKVCLVAGHEERGVHPDTLAVVDHVALLPQLGRIGSLNVAHSVTVGLYEVARQALTSREH